MNWKELAEKARAIAREAMLEGDPSGYFAALMDANYYECLAEGQSRPR